MSTYSVSCAARSSCCSFSWSTEHRETLRQVSDEVLGVVRTTVHREAFYSQQPAMKKHKAHGSRWVQRCSTSTRETASGEGQRVKGLSVGNTVPRHERSAKSNAVICIGLSRRDKVRWSLLRAM